MTLFYFFIVLPLSSKGGKGFAMRGSYSGASCEVGSWKKLGNLSTHEHWQVLFRSVAWRELMTSTARSAPTPQDATELLCMGERVSYELDDKLGKPLRKWERHPTNERKLKCQRQ